MDGTAIMTVSAAVVALTQLLKWAVIPDRWGPVSVLGLAIAGTAFWAWTTGDFGRTTAFGYFAGWVAIATSAAGVYGFTRAASTAITATSEPPAGAGNSATN